MSMKKSILGLIGWIALSELASVIGGFFTASSVRTWYVDLRKPAFNPPGWVFGPVWTGLYIMMGIAAWLVWKSGGDKTRVKTALWLFGIQLVLNAAWSILFFGLRNPMWAWLELVALWISILATAIHFMSINRAAGLLMIPYLAWVTFAGVLNYNIWRLNP